MGVTGANLLTAHTIFKGRGEAVPIFDEKAEEPQFTDQEAEKLFGEGFFNLPTQEIRQKSKSLEEKN